MKEGDTCKKVGKTKRVFFPFLLFLSRFFLLLSPSSLFGSSTSQRMTMVCSSSCLGRSIEDRKSWFVLRHLFVFSWLIDGRWELMVCSSSSLRRWFVSEAEFVDWWKIKVMHQERRSWDSTITRRIKSSSIKVRFFILFLCSIVFKVHSLFRTNEHNRLTSISSLWINSFGLV